MIDGEDRNSATIATLQGVRSRIRNWSASAGDRIRNWSASAGDRIRDGSASVRSLLGVLVASIGPWRLARWLVAAVAGVVVFLVAVRLFPHHSVNHDEAVYLQQAELLAEGRLTMRPAVPEAVRPWFFIRDGGTLYPRYAPVPAAMFALGDLVFGGYRVALGLIAACTVALAGALATAAFDRKVGVLAAGLLAATPAFVLTSAVFLPYAPTTLLNLLFAVAYVRSVRRDHRGYAALAGLAVGLAFFARPYTAVLFAAPFVGHACWRLLGPIRTRNRAQLYARATRQGLVALPGTAFVGVTLAYNAALTGSPWLFPFEVFAPRDGLGFGYRRILDHAVVYTPALGLRTNARVLWELLTRWTVAPPLGAVLFAVGVGQFLAASGWIPARLRRDRAADPGDGGDADDPGTDSGDTGDAADPGADAGDASGGPDPLPDRHLQVLLLGVGVSVAVGNVFFWGNYNVLADPGDPTDGFLGAFGPFYHFDLVVVLAAFGASGALAAHGRARSILTRRVAARTARVALAVLVVTAGTAGVFAQAAALDRPVAEHRAYTDRYAETYAPIEAQSFDRALVFVPASYGPWLNHPFQSLRNDPRGDGRLGGPVVYALDRYTAGDFAVMEAYPDRRPHRFTYRGEWTPDPTDRVRPKLVALQVRTAPAVDARTTVGVPDNARSAVVRLAVDGEAVSRTVADPDDRIAVAWTLAPGGARVDGVEAGNRTVVAPGGSVPIDGPAEVALTVTFTTPDGATLTYRQELDARPHGGGIQAVWPPESSVCRLVTDCGLEGTYLPDADDRPAGVWMNATLNDESE